MLDNKNIILGITGSIAAYKAAILVRLLTKNGANVKVIMTPFAKEFITPLTMATLAKNPVLVDFYNPVNGDWNSHVDLGMWADLMLIAPASANTIAKMANGIADNLLLTTYLSIRSKVMVAPAMDLDMYAHPTTGRNIKILKEQGVDIIDASTGELASGLSGKGRMVEPEVIIEYIDAHFTLQKHPTLLKFKGKNVLITTGPTYEPIDPVRFIGNHSSGKMGYAIAGHLANAGAKVKLVSGPVNISLPNGNINKIDVNTADEMYSVVQKHARDYDIAILVAAVSDFKPARAAHMKIKSSIGQLQLDLVQTPDIAAFLGGVKKNKQVLVGFALETDKEIENATEKLKKKNFDLVVMNSLNDEGAGFKSETNKITIVDKYNNIEKYELKNKKVVALDILNRIAQIMDKQ